MRRRHPRSTRTDTLCPDTTLFRSASLCADHTQVKRAGPKLEAGPKASAMEARRGETPQATRCVARQRAPARSEEHTSELQSLMRISYAVFCLKKKKQQKLNRIINEITQKDRHIIT